MNAFRWTYLQSFNLSICSLFKLTESIHISPTLHTYQPAVLDPVPPSFSNNSSSRIFTYKNNLQQNNNISQHNWRAVLKLKISNQYGMCLSVWCTELNKLWLCTCSVHATDQRQSSQVDSCVSRLIIEKGEMEEKVSFVFMVNRVFAYHLNISSTLTPQKNQTWLLQRLLGIKFNLLLQHEMIPV